MKNWLLYDTTLRDGLQQRGLEITTYDAARLASEIAKLGAAWIEAGFASSGHEQMERIKTLASLNLPNVKIAAFGRTRGTRETVEEAKDIRAILESGAPTATLVGKSRKRDAILSLETSAENNLVIIKESISYLKKKGREVVFDAEHYFDGMKEDAAYTKKVIESAYESGADWIVLCDTNGGASPADLKEGISGASKVVPAARLGFHGHNDRGRALSNAEIAYELGVRHIQGTINGYGERCGNTNLCTLIANLYYDYNAGCAKDGRNLINLTPVSKLADELLNVPHVYNQPWVGEVAFYSEAGMHVSGLLRDPSSYLHVDPQEVGNRLHIGLSEQSGRSNIAVKTKELGFNLSKEEIKQLAQAHDLKVRDGFVYNAADASFYLLILITLWPEKLVKLIPKTKWVVTSFYNQTGHQSKAEISVQFNGREIKKTGFGGGPVEALNNAFLLAAKGIHNKLPELKLVNYQVRIINPEAGTAAKVRVLIETSNGKDIWTTVGVHDNIIEASWMALLDAVVYAIYRN